MHRERCSVLAVLLLAQVLHLSEAYLHSGTVRRPSSAVVRQRQQHRSCSSLAAARGGLSRTDESWDKVEDEVDEVAQAAITAQQPVVRRGPAIRRQLSISDLQGGFAGFKDELEATRLAKEQWDIDNPKKAKKKMPEKPKLIPDTEFRWYVLQVYTGSELQCQSIINSKLIAWKIADRISQVLVPVTKAPHTIGRRVRVKDIPVYLGYVYVEAMMSELVRDTIGRLPRAVGFIGRRKDENGLRIPDAMHPAEVQQILNHMQNCDTVPDVVSEFGIGDMVEILDGSYGGERGALRLVRAEEFVVRLYTFGTQTDISLPFSSVRKLSDAEVLADIAAAEAAKDGSYREDTQGPQRSNQRSNGASPYQQPRNGPREFGDFSGLAKAPLAPREERREREYKKKLEARQRKESGEFNSMIKRSAAQRQAAGPEEGLKRSRPGWTPVPLPSVFDESDVRYTGERKQQQQEQQGDEFEPFEDDDFSEFDDIAAAAGSGSSSSRGGAAGDDKWNSQLDAGLDLDLGSDDLFAALMEELKADAPPAAAAAAQQQQPPQRRAAQPAVAAALPDTAVPLNDDDLFAGLMSELGAFDELEDDAPPAAASLQQQRRSTSPVAAAAGRSSSSELDADLDLDLGSDDMFAALMEELRADAPPVAATAAAAAPKRGADSFAGLMSDAGAFDGEEDTAVAVPAAQGRVTAESTLDELDAASAFEGEYGFDAGYDDEQNTSSSFQSSSSGSSAAAARSGGASSRAARAVPASAGASRAENSEVDELDSFLAMLDDSEGADLFEALEQQQEQQPRAATPAAAPVSAAAALPMRPAEELSFADAANDVPLELPDNSSSSSSAVAGAGAQSVAAASAGTGASAGLSPEVVPQLKVSELKEQLKARGLKVGGKKEELVERLLVAVQST